MIPARPTSGALAKSGIVEKARGLEPGARSLFVIRQPGFVNTPDSPQIAPRPTCLYSAHAARPPHGSAQGGPLASLSLTLIGVLAIGIGATATMVSVLDTLLWRPVAMPRPNELVEMTAVMPDGEQGGTPPAAADQITRAAPLAHAWCAYGNYWFTTRVEGRMMPAGGALMSAECAEVTGMAPLLGRWFTPAEAPVNGRGRPVAVISERYWKRMFDAAPNVLGRTVRLDDGIVTVIGVLPASFSGFDKDLATDIITPFAVFEPSTVTWSLIGRRGPRTSLDSLRGQLGGVWPAIIKDTSAGARNPKDAAQLQVHVESAAAGFSLFRRLYAPALSSVTALAVLLLVLTCINASGLLAAKVASHCDELLVMRALGASGWRIVRQLLAETFLLATVACGVGVVMAYAGTRAFTALLPWGNLPWTIEFTPDFRILAGVAARLRDRNGLDRHGAGVARDSARNAPARSSRTVTCRASRWSGAMLISQLAATVVLGFACGLLVRSFTGLTHVDRRHRS